MFKIIWIITLIVPLSRATAKDLNTYINTEMKRVEAYENLNPVDKREIQAPLGIANPALQKSEESNAYLNDLEPERPGEHMGAMDRPRGGGLKIIDPTEAISQELADKQAHQRYRNNYRKAVQSIFERNAASAGVETHRDLAEEIKRLENSSAH